MKDVCSRHKDEMRFLIGTFSWDADTKAHMMAYDKQLKDLTKIYDEEVILWERL
jgi:hypothetical protein